MATFKVVVRKKRADGFYPVYIRVVHRSRMGYIKTDKLITDKQITKNGEIKDIVVNEYCSREILRYSDMINRKDVSNYSVAELIEFLIHSDEEICFSDYATKFINRMASEGHERNAKNYRLAVNHLERYLGTTRVMFTHLSSSVLTRWINSLSLTNRAKEMYPTCLRQIFKRALIELNDEERGIVRIKYNPWLKVSIIFKPVTIEYISNIVTENEMQYINAVLNGKIEYDVIIENIRNDNKINEKEALISFVATYENSLDYWSENKDKWENTISTPSSRASALQNIALADDWWVF